LRLAERNFASWCRADRCRIAHWCFGSSWRRTARRKKTRGLRDLHLRVGHWRHDQRVLLRYVFGIWYTTKQRIAVVFPRHPDTLDEHLNFITRNERRYIDLDITMHGLFPLIDSLQVRTVEDSLELRRNRGPHNLSVMAALYLDHGRGERFEHLCRRVENVLFTNPLGLRDDRFATGSRTRSVSTRRH